MDVVRYRWELVLSPPGSVARPQPLDRGVTSFEPDMAGPADSPAEYILQLTVWDEEDLSDSCLVRVLSITGAPVAFCPGEQSVAPGAELLLEGGGYDDEAIRFYRWEIVSSPPDHMCHIEDSENAAARFVTTPADSGTFKISLTVIDTSGLSGSCSFNVGVGNDVPVAICPEDMEVPTRAEITLIGNGEDDSGIVSWRWECLWFDSSQGPLITNSEQRDAIFYATSPGHSMIRLSVTDAFGLTGTCIFEITALETPPSVYCPSDIETTPLTELILEGDALDDGTIVEFRWELVDSPDGSSADPPSPETGKTTRFTPDIAGEYRVRLSVTDDSGHTESCEFRVRAFSGHGLRVEIFWNPPERPEDKSDVDVHLLHPDAPYWFHYQLDCYWENCDERIQALEWDGPGSEDDPRLDLDDTDGFGPENINVHSPIEGHTYTVGIHYYDSDGWEDADVFVKIYCSDTSIIPVYETGPVAMKDYGGGPDGNDFWKVARVTWDGSGCLVTPIDEFVLALDAMRRR